MGMDILLCSRMFDNISRDENSIGKPNSYFGRGRLRRFPGKVTFCVLLSLTELCVCTKPWRNSSVPTSYVNLTTKAGRNSHIDICRHSEMGRTPKRRKERKKKYRQKLGYWQSTEGCLTRRKPRIRWTEDPKFTKPQDHLWGPVKREVYIGSKFVFFHPIWPVPIVLPTKYMQQD